MKSLWQRMVAASGQRKSSLKDQFDEALSTKQPHPYLSKHGVDARTAPSCMDEQPAIKTSLPDRIGEIPNVLSVDVGTIAFHLNRIPAKLRRPERAVNPAIARIAPVAKNKKSCILERRHHHLLKHQRIDLPQIAETACRHARLFERTHSLKNSLRLAPITLVSR